MNEFISALIHLDPVAIIQAGGLLGITLVIFAESGLLVGIFFPGDSLLFAAGLLSATGYLSFGPLVVLVVLAAIVGDSTGYWFGKRFGPPLFNRKESFFFKREYVTRTEHFYETYGGRAVILARFVPIVRTIAPTMAGMGSMTYSRFLSYNVIGGLLWGVGMTSLGYFLGAAIPQSEHYILPISLLIIGISFLPFAIGFLRAKLATPVTEYPVDE